MKKLIAFLLCTCLLLAGCGSSGSTVENASAGGSKEMTLNFSYGDRTGTYTGELDEDGLPNGYGTFTSQNSAGGGWTYCGEWEHGHWSGYGVSFWDDGQVYWGEYENDIASGYGGYVLPSGEFSIGTTDNSGLCGIGMTVSDDGTITAGNFPDGNASGWCAVYLTGDYEGYVFWGNFVDGNATGTLYFPNGDTFPATYTDGLLRADTSGGSATEPEETIEETSKPTTSSGELTDEQTETCKDFLDHCQYGDLHEYISTLIADGDLPENESTADLLIQIEALSELSKKCTMSEDAFENKTVIYYSGVTDISNTVNIIPSLTIGNSERPKLEYKLGFKKSGWLFLDEISVVSQNKEAKSQTFDHFDVNRDIIRGGQIQEYVYTSYLDIASFADDENIVIRFKNSDTRETVDHTLTDAEISAVSTLSQIEQIHSSVYKLIVKK